MTETDNRILIAKILKQCKPAQYIGVGARIIKLSEASRGEHDVLNVELRKLYEDIQPVISLEEAQLELDKLIEIR